MWGFTFVLLNRVLMVNSDIPRKRLRNGDKKFDTISEYSRYKPRLQSGITSNSGPLQNTPYEAPSGNVFYTVVFIVTLILIIFPAANGLLDPSPPRIAGYAGL